eukprot:scaffold21275_cov125-Isochrysis_galbana.AAC.3
MGIPSTVMPTRCTALHSAGTRRRRDATMAWLRSEPALSLMEMSRSWKMRVSALSTSCIGRALCPKITLMRASTAGAVEDAAPATTPSATVARAGVRTMERMSRMVG